MHHQVPETIQVGADYFRSTSVMLWATVPNISTTPNPQPNTLDTPQPQSNLNHHTQIHNSTKNLTKLDLFPMVFSEIWPSSSGGNGIYRRWHDMIWNDMKGYDLIWNIMWYDMIWYVFNSLIWIMWNDPFSAGTEFDVISNSQMRRFEQQMIWYPTGSHIHLTERLKVIWQRDQCNG